jgi:hypothetical protein
LIPARAFSADVHFCRVFQFGHALLERKDVYSMLLPEDIRMAIDVETIVQMRKYYYHS